MVSHFSWGWMYSWRYYIESQYVGCNVGLTDIPTIYFRFPIDSHLDGYNTTEECLPN